MKQIPRKHLVVDGSNLLHRVMHVPALQSLQDSTGRYTGGQLAFMKSLRYTLDTQKIRGRAIVVWDAGHSERRKKLFPEYKWRPPKQPGGPDEDGFDYLAEYQRQRDAINAALFVLGVRTITLQGREADDVIYQLVQNFFEEEVLVLSEDRDMLQLVNDSVSVYRPIADEYFDLPTFKEHWGMDPSFWVLYRALTGDSSDNIPGIKGVGHTTAIKLLQHLSDPTLRSLTDYLDSKQLGHREVLIRSNLLIIARNMKLVDLAQESFTLDELAAIYGCANGNCRPVDLFQFMGWAKKYELQSLLDIIASWVEPFKHLT